MTGIVCGESRQRRARVAEAARILTLGSFGSGGVHVRPVLDQLRHGGASKERATGRRERTALAKRGRWASIASLRRYEKGGRLTELVSRLSPAQTALAEDCQSRIGEILCRTLPVTLHGTDRSSSSASLASADGRLRAGRLPRPAVSTCFESDIRWHLKNDLLSPSVQSRIRGWIRSGLICAVWMGTPCNSFSRARDRPGGPPPLRSDDHPNGLPDLAPHDQEKVRVGNILARFSISIFQCCAYL